MTNPLAGEDIESAVAAILSQVDSGECIAWIGSGLSVPANYPGWPATIKKLCEDCGVVQPTITNQSADDFLVKAEECKSRNRTRYNQVLESVFGEQPVTTTLPYKWLLDTPFLAYVTTNLDPLLKEEASATRVDVTRPVHYYPDLPPTAVRRDQQQIFYIHGCARRNEVADVRFVVFSSEDFAEAYGPDGASAFFVNAILKDHPLVFFGCELKEPQIKESFKRVKRIIEKIQLASPGRPTPRRIAIVARNHDGTIDSSAAAGFAKLGIETFWYTPTDPIRHPEVAQIINLVRSRSAAVLKRKAGAQRAV